ncbi:pentatricopeptide repeat-containing protein [Tanacetum coccineum]
MTSLTLFKDMLVDDNVVYGHVVKTGADGDWYVKEGMVKEVRCVFDEMGVKDFVSWNVMITGVSGLSQGEWIHAYVDKNGIEVGGSLFWLSNVHASKGWFNDATELRKKMRAQGVSIDPGCCMIEVNGVVHEFLAGEGMVW